MVLEQKGAMLLNRRGVDGRLPLPDYYQFTNAGSGKVIPAGLRSRDRLKW